MLDFVVDLLRELVNQGGSDLILRAGRRPVARRHGHVEPVSDVITTDAHIDGLLNHLLGPEGMPQFLQDREYDLAAAFTGVGRFRINLFFQRGRPGAVFRHVQESVPTMEELLLPAAPLRRLSMLSRGLVLVTGIAGSGKSTTLASMIQYMNAQSRRHIITIEDPIEYVFRDELCAITQREVGLDTSTFKGAMRAAMRQTPDVLLVGEMRDAETVSAALQAAETGHLVLSTLHTINAVQTVERIISFYPPHQRELVRMQLSLVLEGVVSQRLIRRSGIQGRVPAVEVLLGTPAVKEMVLEGRTRELAEALEEGHEYYGSQSFNQSLAALIRAGTITMEDGLEAADSPDELTLVLRGITKGSSNKDLAFGKAGRPADAPQQQPGPVPGALRPPAPAPANPTRTGTGAPRLRTGAQQF